MLRSIVFGVLAFGLVKCTLVGGSLVGMGANAVRNSDQVAFLSAAEVYEADPRGVARRLPTHIDACVRTMAKGERMPDTMRAYYREGVGFAFKNVELLKKDEEAARKHAARLDAAYQKRMMRTLTRLPAAKRKRVLAVHRLIAADMKGLIGCVARGVTKTA